MPHLIIQSGKHQGKKIGLPEKEVLIGRDEECLIRLGSSDVSRRHCMLRTTSEGILVRDLDSRNGTLVNEVPLDSETLLKAGDRLRVGPMEFLVAVKAKRKGSPAKSPTAGNSAFKAGAGAEPAPSEGLSDDDIAAWLTNEENLGTGEIGPGDTTIIPTASPVGSPPSESPKPPPVAAEAAPEREPEKKRFHSLADEAADIIRRHWEMVRQSEQEEGQQPGA